MKETVYAKDSEKNVPLFNSVTSFYVMIRKINIFKRKGKCSITASLDDNWRASCPTVSKFLAPQV